MVLHALMTYGADATAPALYEVTPLVEGGAISMKQRVLSAASVQSLMAFQMSSGHYRLIMTLNGILHM